MVSLAFDRLDESLFQIERGDPKLFQSRVTSESSNCVEDNSDLFSDFWIDGEKTKISVDPCGSRVIITSSQVHILSEPVAVSTNNEERLTMGLQSHDTVDDVGPRFFEAPGPLNVGGFIKPGP